MNKDHKFGRVQCPECPKLVASNWLKRHLWLYHPVKLFVPLAELPKNVLLVGELSDQTDDADWSLFRKLAGIAL